MISDELAEAMVEEMIKMFGTLPHPDQEPKRCLAVLKLYQHIKQLPKSA